MKHLLIAALIAGTSFVVPTVSVTNVAAVPMPAWAEHLPEAMKRPGGYCDLRQSNETLAPSIAAPPVAAAPPAPPSGGGGCGAIDLRKLFKTLPIGARIHTAC